MIRRPLAVAAIALVCAMTATTPVLARHGFICGLVQRLHFKLPPKYNLALNWARLPKASPAPEVVVVQRRKGRALGGGPGGHVSRIVSVISQCRAIVIDEKGRYVRDICKNLVAYVRP